MLRLQLLRGRWPWPLLPVGSGGKGVWRLGLGHWLALWLLLLLLLLLVLVLVVMVVLWLLLWLLQPLLVLVLVVVLLLLLLLLPWLLQAVARRPKEDRGNAAAGDLGEGWQIYLVTLPQPLGGLLWL